MREREIDKASIHRLYTNDYTYDFMIPFRCDKLYMLFLYSVLWQSVIYSYILWYINIFWHPIWSHTISQATIVSDCHVGYLLVAHFWLESLNLFMRPYYLRGRTQNTPAAAAIKTPYVCIYAYVCT